MWLIVLMSFVVTCTVTICQRITLEKPQLQSACDSSLIGNVDRFRIEGVIAGNVESYLASGWEGTIHIGVSSKFSEEWILCEIQLTTAPCRPDPISQCFCGEVSSDTGAVSFVIDHIAGVALSENTIRAKWKYNASVSVYSNNYTLPQMYDDTAAELVLTVHGTTEESLTESEPCGYSLTLNNSIRLTVCCNTQLTPCYPRISFKDDEVVNKSCVTYPRSELTLGEVTGEAILTYSVCNSTREIPADTCTLASKTTTTRKTTTKSAKNTMTKRTTLTRTTITIPTLTRSAVTRTALTKTTTLPSRPSTIQITSTARGSSIDTSNPQIQAEHGGHYVLFMHFGIGILVAALVCTFCAMCQLVLDLCKTTRKRASAQKGHTGTAAGMEAVDKQVADIDEGGGTAV